MLRHKPQIGNHFLTWHANFNLQRINTAMKITIYRKKLVLMLVYLLFSQIGTAQFLVDMIDTTKNDQKGLWAVYTKRDHLQISGYFQPQFQYAQTKGVENYSGGDFSEFSNNR